MTDPRIRRILLIDADSKVGFPNLALMKISAWHKQQGDSVELIHGIPKAPPLIVYDKAYLSCIYYQNREAVRDYARQLSPRPILGGSGISNELLPDHIEHILPDYDLYDVGFSMGFTSRGCIRKCGWCIVPKKEGEMKDHAPISEFLDPRHKGVILLDNNFTASPRRYENLAFLRDRKIAVNFCQGLDIRKVNDKFAKALAEVNYRDWKFKRRTLAFAFDRPRYEKAVRRGIEVLGSHGIRSSNLLFFVLVGFNTTIEEDLERIRILQELGVYPFVMRYNQGQGDRQILKHLSRWVNGRSHKFYSFKQYLKERGINGSWTA